MQAAYVPRDSRLVCIALFVRITMATTKLMTAIRPPICQKHRIAWSETTAGKSMPPIPMKPEPAKERPAERQEGSHIEGKEES